MRKNCWEKGILGIDCPDMLMNAVFFKMVKFCVYVEGENTGVLSCRNSSSVMRGMQMVKSAAMWCTLNLVQKSFQFI